jgi:exosome complex component RRP42
MMGSNKVVSEILRDYIHNSLEEGKRIDGRGYDDYRPVTIETNVIESAEGSARLHIGNTDVLAGIKMTVGEPFPDTPNVGVMTTNAELIPMASPTFESGPPDARAIELSRVVDRGLREGHAVDMEKLCIKEGEQVWIMFIDIHILDYDGNLFDAAALAAMSALASATVPASQYDLGEDFPHYLVHPVPRDLAYEAEGYVEVLGLHRLHGDPSRYQGVLNPL